MDAEDDHLDGAAGLRLIRAFLALPADKRAEVISWVEDLARAHALPEAGIEASPE